MSSWPPFCISRRPMLCKNTSTGSVNSGLHRQRAKSLYGLRKSGPPLRGFTGETSSCNARCIIKYASALELARSQVNQTELASCAQKSHILMPEVLIPFCRLRHPLF